MKQPPHTPAKPVTTCPKCSAMSSGGHVCRGQQVKR